MNKTKVLVLLSLFAVLMTVFGNVMAQDSTLPAFKVSSSVTDEKVVLTTKNFPADTNYTVSMGNPDDPENYTPVAKFNSKTGGNLNVTVKIPAKFQGLYTISLMLQDADGGKILGSFVNDPALAPVEEPEAENTAEEPISLINQESAEEPVSEEPAAEEGAEEPKAEEGADETVLPQPERIIVKATDAISGLIFIVSSKLVHSGILDITPCTRLSVGYHVTVSSCLVGEVGIADVSCAVYYDLCP